MVNKMNIKSNNIWVDDNLKTIDRYKIELLIIVVYTILHVLLCCFHEGCFDEVHAWNIAKDGSLYEIIFKVPYYEGHPALWHLILVPFAKLGMPYKVSMLIITTVFSVISILILELKAPFPKPVKFLLPFSYFFFYQYGVIARPYCMMVLALLMLSVFYKDRDARPIRYVLTLIFLSATSAFGTALAGGMAAVWLCKIFKEYIRGRNGTGESSNITQTRRNFLKDIRLYCLVVLLLYAVFLLARVLPLNPYGGMSYVGVRRNGAGIRSLYLFLGLFSDLFFTNSYTHDFLADFTFDRFELITTCVMGVVILGCLVYIGKKIKNLSEFVLPYISLSVFSVLVYFGVHNSGILFLFIIYWLWISWDKITGLMPKNEIKDKGLGKMLNPVVIGLIFIALPLFWSVSAGITDIKYTYSFGEKEAEFLKENGLENSSICFEWKTVRDESRAGTLEYYDMKHIINMDRIYAYMDKPTFINWPFDYSLYTFFHATVTDEENTRIIENIMNNPLPDVLIGEPDLKLINGSEYELSNYYMPAYKGKIVKPWKNRRFEDDSIIYVLKAR